MSRMVLNLLGRRKDTLEEIVLVIFGMLFPYSLCGVFGGWGMLTVLKGLRFLYCIWSFCFCIPYMTGWLPLIVCLFQILLELNDLLNFRCYIFFVGLLLYTSHVLLLHTLFVQFKKKKKILKKKNPLKSGFYFWLCIHLGIWWLSKGGFNF